MERENRRRLQRSGQKISELNISNKLKSVGNNEVNGLEG